MTETRQTGYNATLDLGQKRRRAEQKKDAAGDDNEEDEPSDSEESPSERKRARAHVPPGVASNLETEKEEAEEEADELARTLQEQCSREGVGTVGDQGRLHRSWNAAVRRSSAHRELPRIYTTLVKAESTLGICKCSTLSHSVPSRHHHMASLKFHRNGAPSNRIGFSSGLLSTTIWSVN